MSDIHSTLRKIGIRGVSIDEPGGTHGDNVFCKCHKWKGHATERCRKLRDLLPVKFMAVELRGLILPQNYPQDVSNSQSNKRVDFIHRGTPSRTIILVPITSKGKITFSVEDAWWLNRPYDDDLVITTNVNNFKVARILIDIRSKINMIFSHTFSRMGGQRNLRLSGATIWLYQTTSNNHGDHFLDGYGC